MSTPRDALRIPPTRKTSLIRSSRIAVEAALHLKGLLDVPDVKCANAKQARAVLWNAACLQEHLGALGREEGHLPPRVGDAQRRAFNNFALAIVGPAGIGKQLF